METKVFSLINQANDATKNNYHFIFVALFEPQLMLNLKL